MQILAVSSYSDRQFINGMLAKVLLAYYNDEAPLLLDATRSIIHNGGSYICGHQKQTAR
jgi:hypothetical protein